MAKAKAKTDSGFEFTLVDGATDDWEVLESLNGITEGDVTKYVFIFKRLLGDKQYEALKDHLRDESGRVPVTKMIDELQSILKASNETKNS